MHAAVRSAVVGSAVAIGVAFAAAAPAAGDDDGWRLEKDKDGIQVYMRKVEGWSIREIKGVTRSPARLSALVAVVDDLGALHELNHLVVEARVTERESDQRYRYYSATDMPWPLSDRELLNQREIVQDPATLAVRVVDDALPGVIPPRQGFVRMDQSHQRWDFAPAGDGQVTVTLRMLADPNGPIPASIINAMSVDVPLETISALKRLALQPPYANAQLSFIQEPAASTPPSSP